MIHFKFKHSQYPIKVWVFFNCTQEETLPHLNNSKKHPIKLTDLVDDPEDHKSEVGKHVMFKDGNFFIWLKQEPNTPLQKANLAHEVFHAVAEIRTYIGAPTLTDNTEEDWAYMTSWLTENIYKRYETHSRGRRGTGVVSDSSSK